MLQSELKNKFSSILKGVNFITPEVIEYIEVDNYICEISKGKFLNTDLYGISTVNTDTNKHEFELSAGGFKTLELAKAYIYECIGDNREEEECE